jgi:hypothetical protein
MASNPTGLFPVTDPARHAKGRQKMHGLALYTTHVWEAAAATQTSLCRIHGMEVDTERVALEIAPALAAIRTLDLEVVKNSQTPADQTRYTDTLASQLEGQVVRGLLLLRNADIHLPATVDVQADRVVGEGTGFRVMPIWKSYHELPSAIRTSTGTAASAHSAYRAAVAGRLVIETLLDAFAFFRRCDPSLPRLVTGTQDLEYFPLRPYATHDYERRHPDMPNRAQVDEQVRQATQESPPYGSSREILHRLDLDDGPVYCGYSLRLPLRTAFTEPEAQVARDIEAGFPYVALDEQGDSHPVAVDATGQLAAAGTPLAKLALPAPRRHPLPETWHAWWDLAATDAFWYRNQRHLRDGTEV